MNAHEQHPFAWTIPASNVSVGGDAEEPCTPCELARRAAAEQIAAAQAGRLAYAGSEVSVGADAPAEEDLRVGYIVPIAVGLCALIMLSAWSNPSP